MNLGNIFKRDNQSVRMNDPVRVAEPMSKGERLYRMQNEIRNLAPGQTIQGSVVSRDGTSVQVSIGPDMLVNARIEQSISLALGQSMSFEVKANNGSILSLTPLYANMANEATVMRALAAAGLPDTANNIEMVAVMMKEGMPIDKEALSNISRLMMEFPKQDPASLIQMTRLGLPITELNIEQFEMYRNMQHQLLGSAETIMNGLPGVFGELLGEGSVGEAFAFYGSVLDIFAGEGAEDTVTAKGAEQTESADGTVVFKDASAAEDGAANESGRLTDDGTQQAASKGTQEPQQQAVLTDRQWNALSNMLKELGLEEGKAEQVKNGQLPPKEVLALIREFIPKSGEGSGHDRMLARLLGGREFKSLLKAEVGRQWLIEPKDVADPHKVEQLYERIREQNARLSEALQLAGKADVPVARSVQTMQGNVDFMNQLNQMYTYVQLPLKMAGSNAHGDLYVYTNKKNLAARDGNVSALLHLDMEHLGAMDIYVAMQHNKVSTNFTLQDEGALDLIEQHIDLLNERLTKRGYDLKAQFQIKEKEAGQEEGIMQTILSQGKNISVLSRTSFDMRA